MSRTVDQTTGMLAAASRGDAAAAERLLALLYDELRALAAALLRRERAGHTLQATALVNEAYLKLIGPGVPIDVNGRTHFKAIAARAMAQVLIEHARAHEAAKRGGGWQRLPLEEAASSLAVHQADSSRVSEALSRLAVLDERKARGVELRFFGGLSNTEIAEVLGVSLSTVEGDWRVARAWLRRELHRKEEP